MHPITRVAVAAITVVVVACAGPNLPGPSAGSSPAPGSVAGPTPRAVIVLASATPRASAPAAPSPSPFALASSSPSPLDTSTWKTYRSDRYGFSIGHPADWTERPADHTWTLAADADWLSSASEGFNKGDEILATAWSVAVAPRMTAEAWLAAYCPLAANTPCSGLQDRTTAVTMDGHSGSLVQFDGATEAFTLVGDRMYVVAVWEVNSDPRTAPYGGAVPLLEAYLSTVHRLPGGPSAPASPSPSLVPSGLRL